MDTRFLQVASGAEPHADLALLETQEARPVEHVVEELQVLALGYARHVVLRRLQPPARGPVLVEPPRALGAVARGADPDGVLLVLGPVERPRDEVVQGEVGAPLAVYAAAGVLPLLHVLPDRVPGDLPRLELLEAVHDEGPLALADPGRLRDDLGVLPVHEVVDSPDGGGWHDLSLIRDENGVVALKPCPVLDEGKDEKGILYRIFDGGEGEERADGGGEPGKRVAGGDIYG